MEDDDDDNPFFNAVLTLELALADDSGDSRSSRERLCQFLTNTTPPFPQGIPHALGLHIADAPLHEVLSSQAELIRALTAEVRGLAAIVNERLPPPGVSAPAPPAPAPTPALKPSAQPPPPKLPTTKPSAPPKAPPKPSAQPPSFASITKSPARPSLVLSPAPNSSPTTAVRKTRSEICAHLNGVLSALLLGSSLSAARWTKNNNLVIVAGPDTTSQHLQKASAALSNAVTHFIAINPSQPIPISAKENVRWSRLLINNVPTGASSSRGAYSPTECHDTLIRDNPAYWTLSLTRLPSWVKRPDSYAAGSSSSLVVCFEDPTGLALRTLLSHRTLFAFGQAGDLRLWKQKPRAKASISLTDRPLAPA
ncbi:hypothetical protein EDB85DRAFT_1895457 [Lactarius pseudohatsudake]|nr:hypothetical protein EDB85DRAFT_1895457 [Lactarius pseudohatsudake]